MSASGKGDGGKLLASVVILLMTCAVSAHATWTTQINSDGTCTSGTSCTQTVSPTSGWLVYVAAGQGLAGGTLSSCCGGSGCTWTQDVQVNNGTAGSIVVEHSTNCGGTNLALGPTWSSACGGGPSCHTSVYAFSTSTSLSGVDGTPCSGTAFTWCTPASLTSKNDVFVAVIVTSGDATGCSGGSSPTCHLDANGNGTGFEINVTGTSYSAPSWTGTSSTNNVGTAAFAETTSGGGGCTPRLMLTHAGGPC